MKYDFFEKICDFYAVGAFMSATAVEISGYCHPVFCIDTEKGRYLVKQYLLSELTQLKFSIETQQVFYDAGIVSPLPISQPEGFFQIDERCWVMRPWVEGKRLCLEEIHLSHIQAVAILLARIHKTAQRISVPTMFTSHIKSQPDKDLIDFYHKYDRHRFMLNENRIMMHGDLTPANIIWWSDQKPVCIDWDRCGYLNQDVDLFNTAINWCGIELGYIDQEKYVHFMQSYQQEIQRDIHISEAVIYASFGSWLDWINEVQIILPKEKALNELMVSKRALKYISNNISVLTTRLY